MTWALLALALLVGAWPFMAYLGSVPLQPDSMTWIERSHPGAEGWSEWVFQSSHFVGYRPLTALTFTADLQLFGYSSQALRLTDLALHLAAAGVIFLLARRLAGAWPGLLAALVFLAHPGGDEVVPFLARRSYSIATLGGGLGLLFASCAVSAQASFGARALALALAGPVLLLGMFGNELGGLLALALPVIAFGSARAGGRGRAWLVTGWGWLCIGVGILIRHRVMQGDGGYDFEGAWLDRALSVLSMYGAALVGDLQGAGGGWTVVIAALGLYYAWTAVGLLRGRRRTIVPLGLLLVLLAYGVTVASQGVWFPRQVYPAAALVALLAAVVAGWTVGDAELRLGLRAFHAAGLTLLLLVLLHDSPLLRGPSPERVRMAGVATDLVRDVEASTAGLELPARVFLVAPTVHEPTLDRASLQADWGTRASRALERRIQVPFRWLTARAGDTELRFRELAYVMDGGAVVVETEPALQVHLPTEATCFEVSGRRVMQMPPGQRVLHGHTIKPRGAPALVWAYSPDGGSLIPVARPAR